MREVLLYLQRPGKTLPEKQASPRSGFPCWIFSFFKNLFLFFLTGSSLKVLDFLAHYSSPLLYKSITKISTRWNLQNSFFPKFVKNILMIHIPKVSTRENYNILSFYLQRRVQKCLTCLHIILPPISISVLLLCQKYSQDVPKISPRYSQDIPILYKEEFKGAWLACTLFFPPLRTRAFYGRLSFPDHFIPRTFGNCNL